MIFKIRSTTRSTSAPTFDGDCNQFFDQNFRLLYTTMRFIWDLNFISREIISIFNCKRFFPVYQNSTNALTFKKNTTRWYDVCFISHCELIEDASMIRKGYAEVTFLNAIMRSSFGRFGKENQKATLIMIVFYFLYILSIAYLSLNHWSKMIYNFIVCSLYYLKPGHDLPIRFKS